MLTKAMLARASFGRLSIGELKERYKSAPKRTRKPRKYEETNTQKDFFDWLGKTYPELRKICFHIPNGGAKSAKYGHHLKLQGVTPGVCDVFCSIPKFFIDDSGSKHYQYLGLYIEFKSKTGPVKQEQKDFMAAVTDRRYKAVIARSLEEATNAFKDYVQEGCPEAMIEEEVISA